MLAVFGIAAYHGVLLLKHFRYLEVKEGLNFGPDLIIRGLQNRVAPILMTAICTAAVFLPIALYGNVPGMEILHPLSLVTLGGLVTSLIVTLFVLPGLYLAFGRISDEVMREEESMIELDVEVSIDAN